MPSAFSLEGRIDNMLRELGCGGRPFVDICRDLGVQIAHGPFSEALSGKGKPFDHETAQKLLDVLQRMAVLQSEVPVPIRWSETKHISDVLALRLASQTALELRVTNTAIDLATSAAMTKIGAQS